MFHVKPLIERPLPGDEDTAAKFTNSTRYRIAPSPFSVHPVGSKEFRIRVAADRHHYRHGADNRCDTPEYRGQSTRARPGPSVSRETPSIAHLSIRPLREIHSRKPPDGTQKLSSNDSRPRQKGQIGKIGRKMHTSMDGRAMRTHRDGQGTKRHIQHGAWL